MEKESINLKSPEQKEKKKWAYFYIDHKTETIAFECEAADITEADKKYQEATGNNAEKQSYIGITREDWITPEALQKYKDKNETHIEKEFGVFYEVSEEFKKIYFSATPEKLAEIYSKLFYYPDFDSKKIESIKKRELNFIQDFMKKSIKEDRQDSLQSTFGFLRLFLKFIKKDSFQYEKMTNLLEKLNVTKSNNIFLSEMMYNGYSDEQVRSEEQWKEVKDAFFKSTK